MYMDRAENEQTGQAQRADVTEILIARRLVVVGLLTSGPIHVALTPEHLLDAPLLGLGFLAVGALQCAFAVIFFLARAARVSLLRWH